MNEYSNLPLDSFKFDIHSLIAGLIFGAVGFWLFRDGRRNSNLSDVIIGIILMAYPMFVEGPILNWGLGLVLCAYAYYDRKY